MNDHLIADLDRFNIAMALEGLDLKVEWKPKAMYPLQMLSGWARFMSTGNLETVVDLRAWLRKARARIEEMRVGYGGIRRPPLVRL